MSTLKLSLREEPPQRLDLSLLVPERLAGLSAREIERIVISTSRAECCVGDVFEVTSGDAQHIVIEGGSCRFDQLGAGMAAGSLVVEGDAGLCVGRAMVGGTIEVRGKVGPYAASSMRGGMLLVQGDAGDCLGGPLAGERIGMAGGLVLVRGSAGVRAGHRLRRGTIVVEGDVGDLAANGMVAGTVVVCGRAKSFAGLMMRRGTLVLGTMPEDGMLPTFVPVGGSVRIFSGLLAAALRPVSARASSVILARGARLIGDMATLGRGEVMVASMVS